MADGCTCSFSGLKIAQRRASKLQLCLVEAAPYATAQQPLDVLLRIWQRARLAAAAQRSVQAFQAGPVAQHARVLVLLVDAEAGCTWQVRYLCCSRASGHPHATAGAASGAPCQRGCQEGVRCTVQITASRLCMTALAGVLGIQAGCMCKQCRHAAAQRTSLQRRAQLSRAQRRPGCLLGRKPASSYTAAPAVQRTHHVRLPACA